MRTFLIVGIACAVIGGAGIYAFVTLLGPGIASEIDRIRNEATAFGRANDRNACVDETFRRLHACDGFVCEVQQLRFTEHCLNVAAAGEGFCDDVPESIVDGVLWTRTAACPDDDIDPRVCERVLNEILQACMRFRS